MVEPGPIGIGVLGAAAIAQRRTVPAMTRCPGLRVTAVASRDRARAVALAGTCGAAALGSYAELLDRSDVEAVYLPLPAGLRGRWVRRALSAGKHVLAEKPLTISATETVDLVRLARDRGLVLMENFAFLHHRRQREVRRLLDEEAIGQVRTFSAAFGIPRLPAGDIRYQPELGGGALFDVGVYPLRAAAHFLPGPLTVLGARSFTEEDFRVDVGGHVLLRAANGVTAELSYGLDHAYRSEYEFWGSTGTLSIARAYAAPPELATTVVLRQGTAERTLDVGADDQFLAMLGEFLTAIDDPDGRERQYRHATGQAELVGRIAAAAGPAR